MAREGTPAPDWARAFDETGRLDWGRARVATGVAVLGLAGYLLTWWAA